MENCSGMIYLAPESSGVHKEGAWKQDKIAEEKKRWRGYKGEAEELKTATVWQVSHLRFDPAFLLR